MQFASVGEALHCSAIRLPELPGPVAGDPDWTAIVPSAPPLVVQVRPLRSVTALRPPLPAGPGGPCGPCGPAGPVAPGAPVRLVPLAGHPPPALGPYSTSAAVSR